MDSVTREIESKIYLIRNLKVMLDRDLAVLYGVTTKRINEQVMRNSDRFPIDFAFLLTSQELAILKSQFATSSLSWGGRRKPATAFTEQGFAMLSSVLRSPRAIQTNISIMRAFVQMRAVLHLNRDLERKLTALESKYDGRFKLVFEAIRELMSDHKVPRKRIIGLGD